MKGIIFNLLEDMVEQEGGPAAWDGLLDAAAVDGGYSSLGAYPDAELVQLIGARARQLGQPEQAVERAFGRHALLSLAVRYPGFFTPHRRTRDFVLTLNDVIHPEVRKLHAAADPPHFEFEARDENHLAIGYRSRRRLCGFAEGMIAGAATHFGESIHIVQEPCVHSGGDHCVIHCTFQGQPDDSITVAG